MAESLSIRAYAKHRGVSHVAVLRALREGRVTAQADGMIDPDVADREWAENTRPHPVNGNGGPRTLVEAQRQVAELKGELLRLELAVKRGDFVPRKQVESDGFAAGRRSRDAMLNVPRRAMPFLGPLLRPGTEHEAEQVIEGAVREAIEDLTLTLTQPKPRKPRKPRQQSARHDPAA